MTDRFGEQAVFGRNLVGGRSHERVVDLVDAGGDRALHPGDNDVEIVECPEAAEPHGAALRCAWVDVIEALEPCRILEVAEQREAVMPGVFFGLRDADADAEWI